MKLGSEDHQLHHGLVIVIFLCHSFLQDKTIRMWNIEKADAIPMVMETKKLTGLRLLSVSVTFHSKKTSCLLYAE